MDTTNGHVTVELRLVIDLEDEKAIAYLDEMPGFHFPVPLSVATIGRIRQLHQDAMEATMICPECGGTGDGAGPCPTCRGTGRLTSDGRPITNRHSHRQRPSHNPRRAAAIPKRTGHNDDPDYMSRINGRP